MKISLNWLSDYVALPSPEELARKLTMAGLEIEGVEKLGEGLDGVIVCQILESAQHPNAEKLSVTRVDAGPAGALQVVCGAKNYKVGDKVPLATVGTKLPGGQKIEKAALRGVDSFGMLCSSRELGITEDAAGLLILDPSLKPGAPIADALHLKDVVFEVNVTPNRPDCLSHLGIAREVAALTGAPLKMPDATVFESATGAESMVKVRIDDLARCPRYAARVLENVKLGASPLWMQNRLRAVGVRALSNAVDVTNYVMLECGQPLHAFDLDLVAGGQIIVRRAAANEKMTTLDGKERALSTDDLCICDEKSPSALAGVMGGATSEINPKTTRILLESAAFQPGGIRRTARRHALHSESSHRFERGIDPAMVAFAQDRAAKLLAELCGASVARGRVDAHGELPAPRRFTLRFARIGELLGTSVPKETTEKILSGLGFRLQPKGNDAAEVEVPSWRLDVEGEADCVEEVARFRGYDSVPAAMPRGPAELPGESRDRAVESRLRVAMAGAGFDEVVNYSFVAAKDLEVLTPGEKLIALKNPIAADQAVMCTTRLAGLLGNLRHSRNRQVEDVRLYEVGRVYRPAGKEEKQPAIEPKVVAGVLAGSRVPLQWAQARVADDFFDLKGALEQMLEAVGIRDASFESAKGPSLLHPRSACEIKSGGVSLGWLGEVHPTAAQQLDLPRGVFVFELSFEALVSRAKLVPPYKGVPRFPAVLRDLAVVLDDGASAAAVDQAIAEAGGELFEGAVLFDVYRGENIPKGKKSLAYAIRYRAADRTLTDDEVNKAHARIVAALGERLGATLRA